MQLDPAELPISAATRRAATKLRIPAWRLALSGGEDFELAVAVAPKHVQATIKVAAAAGVRLSAVGRVVARPGLWLLGAPGGAAISGFEHFATARHNV
ncbi:MAG: hypothetical protein HYZ27_08690 [Deltaproteobacteria bacterium]|nr:hypothetical protein [Deltaproteobacteria bacterium]